MITNILSSVEVDGAFMVMPVHIFESKPPVMSRYWYATHAPYDTVPFRSLKRKKMEWNETQLVTVLFHAVTTHYSQQALTKYHIQQGVWQCTYHSILYSSLTGSG